jgi:hypothetical protein
VCPSGLKIISGGFTTSIPLGSGADLSEMLVSSSVFAGLNSWSVTATNTSGGNNSALVLTAYAVCAFVQ